jgi:hypothetical protein
MSQVGNFFEREFDFAMLSAGASSARIRHRNDEVAIV